MTPTSPGKSFTRLLTRLLLGCLFLALAVLPSQAQQPKETLVIAMSYNFQPFTFVNAQGEPAGVFIDMWRLWGEKNHQKIEFLVSDWKTSLDNLRSGKADIHSGLIYSPQRSRWLTALHAFYRADIRFFSPRQQGRIDNISQLAGETVAVVTGSATEEYLKTNYPQIRLLSVASPDDLLKPIRKRQTAGFFTVALTGSSLIDHYGVTGDFNKSGLILYQEDFHPGVLKEKPELAEYVDQGMNAITDGEWAEIEARWVADPALRHFKPTDRVQLTTEEELWRKAHPIIRVGMSPVLPPLKFRENGVIKGVEPDFLQEIAGRAGLKFEFVVCPFAEMDAKVQAGELDMFLSFNIPGRLTYMSFTEPFMDFKQVVIGRSNIPFVGGLAALKGMRVATIKGVKLHEKILRPYPEIQSVPCETMEQAFQMVAEGKADVLLSKTLFADYLMERYPHLKVAGVLDLPPEPYLYAVRKDYPKLVGILNKAIAAIPIEKRDAIAQKWISVHLDYRPNWSEIRRWSLAGGGGVALLLGMAFWANWRLAREVERQRVTTEALDKSQAMLSETGRVAKVGGWDFDVETKELVWTDEVYRIYEVGKMHKPTVTEAIEFYTPVSRLIIAAALQRSIDFGEPFDLELEIVTANGKHRWVHSIGKANQEKGKTRRVFGTFQDITERKKLKNALLVNHEQLQLVLQGSQLGFWDWNIETGEVRRNERWAEMLGYTLQEVEFTVKQWTDLIHPDDRARAWTSIQDHLEGRSAKHMVEYRMLTKDGGYKWILDQAKIVTFGDDGRPLRMTGTHTDITGRKEAELVRIREQVESEERTRLAREIHDGSGQSLQAIRLHLKLLAAGKGGENILSELNDLAKSVAETANELREISHQLRPSYLQEVTLDAALRDRCNVLTRRGVPVSLDCTGDFSALPGQVNDNFYRVSQEALTNAVRHAGAKKIRIDLTRSGSRLTLSVTDDGHGIEERTSGQGLGLQIMQERAALIGATLTISSNSSGTSVTLTQEGI